MQQYKILAAKYSTKTKTKPIYFTTGWSDGGGGICFFGYNSRI